MNREVPLFLLALTLPMAAQVRFEVPLLGYVYDPAAKAIRAVSGVPGAAMTEANVAVAGSVERAWISNAGFAVVRDKQDGTRLVNWARAGEAVALDGADIAAVSGSGRFFAVRSGSNVEIWDGAEAARKARFTVAGDVRALAISDDGGAVLAATGASVLAWRGSLETVWSGEVVDGVGFLDGTRDFAAFDSARGKVLLSRGGAVTEIESPLAGATAFGVLGSRLAFGGEHGIAVYDLSTGLSQTIATELPVQEFARAGSHLQVRFRDDMRMALLEMNAENTAAQVEFLVGGAR